MRNTRSSNRRGGCSFGTWQRSGRKLGKVQAKLAEARQESNHDPQDALGRLTPAEREVQEASIAGDRQTLRVDAVVPGVMALIYVGLLLYFRHLGGYKVIHLKDSSIADGEVGSAIEA